MNNDCINRQEVVKILILPTACTYRSTKEIKSYLKAKETMEREARLRELRRARN